MHPPSRLRTRRPLFLIGLTVAALAGGGLGAGAQVPPTPAQVAAYTGLHAAAARDDAAGVHRLLRRGADPDAHDADGRTAAHVAAHLGRHGALVALLDGGADPNALDRQRYDVVTIAAVRNDARAVRIAVVRGARAGNVTSPYDGTALIAAAHLGNVAAVRDLLRAGAPVDHVNNLGWTALLEAVILGDGGPRHQAVVRMLVLAGADRSIADRDGMTPLAHARQRGYTRMVSLLRL